MAVAKTNLVAQQLASLVADARQRYRRFRQRLPACRCRFGEARGKVGWSSNSSTTVRTGRLPSFASCG